MSDKVTLQSVSSIDSSLISAINNNNQTIQTAFDNTLSRNGQTPNQMSAAIDMNSNPILNIPYASLQNQPVALGQLSNIGTSLPLGFPTLTGDVTGVVNTGTGQVPTTLATVNSNVGTFGSTSAIPSLTVNAKGLVTAATTVSPIVAPAASLTPNSTNFISNNYTIAATDYLRSFNNFGATGNITITVPNTTPDGLIFFVNCANASHTLTLAVNAANFIVYDGTATQGSFTVPIGNNNNLACIFLSGNLLVIGMRIIFTSSNSGIVPASGGGVTNFLRADGTWNAPSGGTGTPTVQVFTSGSATYTPTGGTVYIKVRMMGAGGGGGAAATNAGSVGGDTIFGSWHAKGGGGGPAGNGAAQNGGIGGTGGANGTGTQILRAPGIPGSNIASGASNFSGGYGGWTWYYSFDTQGPSAAGPGNNAPIANSGCGGSGAFNASNAAGAGGGGGEWVEFFVSNPTATSYTVGAAGSGGAAGTQAGGNGAAGAIYIEEYPF